jgi:hypothetical protein
MISGSEGAQTHPLSNSEISNTIWSKRISSHLTLVKSDQSATYNVVPEIQKLVRELAQFEEVKRVRAIATSFPDTHWIDFQLELAQVDTYLSDEIWDKIHDLVIDCEWKLRDDTCEKWYFRPQVVDTFYAIKEQVIADSDEKQQKLADKPKILSSNPSNIILL